MNNNFKGKCGSCKQMDINNCRGYRYYCRKRASYYEAVDPNTCYAYDFDEERDYDELERMEKAKRCYITTVLCEILGFDDNCEILSIMRELRRNVLQKDLRYLGLMMEYDDIGPVIAESLRNDNDALWIAKELLEHYIKPIIKYVGIKNYDTAIVLYYNMTNLLKENYQIVDNNEIIEDYDQSNGGHGRVYKKVNC